MPLELGSSLCRLTRLHLVGVFLNSSFAEQISNVCIALEDLELKDCQLGFHMIASLSLVNLIIVDCRISDEGGSGRCDQLTIKAPHLASLHLDLKISGFQVSVTEMLSLVKASILLKVYSSHRIDHIKQLKFLSNLLNVTNLELSGFDMMVMPDDGPFEFPIFKNLRTLLLENCDLGDNVERLWHLLKKSPNLEKLTMQCCKASKGSNIGKGKTKSRKTKDLLKIRCRKLKCTEILCEDADDVRQLVNALLDIAGSHRMNTVTIKNVGISYGSDSE